MNQERVREIFTINKCTRNPKVYRLKSNKYDCNFMAHLSCDIYKYLQKLTSTNENKTIIAQCEYNQILDSWHPINIALKK